MKPVFRVRYSDRIDGQVHYAVERRRFFFWWVRAATCSGFTDEIARAAARNWARRQLDAERVA